MGFVLRCYLSTFLCTSAISLLFPACTTCEGGGEAPHTQPLQSMLLFLSQSARSQQPSRRYSENKYLKNVETRARQTVAASLTSLYLAGTEVLLLSLLGNFIESAINNSPPHCFEKTMQDL